MAGEPAISEESIKGVIILGSLSPWTRSIRTPDTQGIENMGDGGFSPTHTMNQLW